ncbi:MAG: hypothetical protein ACXABK_06310, partial [Candidatus Heimdallarchaeaceae archaeon]
AGCQTLKDKMLKVGSENPSLHSLVQDIDRGLNSVIEGKQLPTDIGFTVPSEIIASPTQAVSKPPEQVETSKVEETAETISPDQIQFVAPATMTETNAEPAPVEHAPTPEAKEIAPAPTEPKTSSRPIIKEKLFAEPEEMADQVKKEEPPPAAEPAPTPEVKPKPKPERVEEEKKVDTTKKPIPEGKPVSAKIEKILNLFISYARQADTDENWKARIAAICDMDEAYIELGGLAMSQIYAYQTQTIKKKKEFERLLTSWMENGLPR